MRRTLAFVSMTAALLVSATAGRAADYAIDPTHSHILFTIDHLGFRKNGRLIWRLQWQHQLRCQ